jgi:phosphoribosyl-AMP cyclohydrolase
MGGGELLAFEKKKTDAKIGAIDAPKEVGERLEVGLNSHESVKRTLSMKEVLFKRSAKKMKEKGSVRGESGRDATEKRTRMRGLPNPDRS